MKRITYLSLVILSFVILSNARAQDSVSNAPFRVKIILNKQQKSNDFRGIQSTFKKAGITLNLEFETRKNRTDDKRTWTFPPLKSHQFNRQQKEWRDLDFPKGFPDDLHLLYIYCVPGDTLDFFAIPHKSVGFIGVKNGCISEQTLEKLLFTQFGVTETDQALLHTIDGQNSVVLSKLQQNKIPFRFTDDYENIPTSNGRVAFYFWHENPDGTFRVNPENPMEQFTHPFKQNHFYVYLDVTNPFFKPRFQFLGYRICLIHLITVCLSLLIQFLIFRKINRRMLESRFFKRMSWRLGKLTIWSAVIGSNILVFYATEFYYTNYHMKFHEISSFHGKSQSNLQHQLDDPNEFQSIESYLSKSQVFRQIDASWYAQREDRVLYFDIDSNNQARFLHSRNVLELKTMDYRKSAQSHYVVFRYLGKNQEVFKEKVYNHMGVELTKKMMLPDPPKRILVFVNGYRPVSTNQSMSDFLNTFQEKGVEFPNSKNQLYAMDRFDYWEPWGQINQLFQLRLQADEIWYADGHHSVTTSNHRSVVNFAGSAAVYPKVCRTKKHHCYQTTLPTEKKISTTSLLATNPNYDGFNLRFKQGKIAGYNLLQVLNEAPNFSKNDTIYLVSHSMGHAYALGMATVLKGHIQFGHYFAIAPENPKGKKMDISAWKQVWQFGTMRVGPYKQAPCQQDGVAPQTLMKGLSSNQRITFPLSIGNQLGFFNSHFIGNYKWIFDIPKGQAGHVPQH